MRDDALELWGRIVVLALAVAALVVLIVDEPDPDAGADHSVDQVDLDLEEGELAASAAPADLADALGLTAVEARQHVPTMPGSTATEEGESP